MSIQISPATPASGPQSTTGPRIVAGDPGATAATGVAAQPTAQPAAQPPVQEAVATSPAKPVDTARLNEAVEAINSKLREGNQELRFAVDHDSGHVIVKVVDTTTDQTIRQIPSEVAIAISHSLEKLQGLLVRQEA